MLPFEVTRHRSHTAPLLSGGLSEQLPITYGSQQVHALHFRQHREHLVFVIGGKSSRWLG